MNFLKKTVVFAVALGICVSNASAPTAQITSLQTSQYQTSLKTVEKKAAKNLSEWEIIALARSENGVSKAVAENRYKSFEKKVKDCKGVLSASKYTEYSKAVLALSAIGKDVKNVGGYDLLKKLSDYENVTKQGINGAAFALLALDCKDYEIERDSTVKVLATRQKYIDFIISRQHKDGGFGLSDASDVDLTAMALQSLAKYTSQEKVKTAVQKGLEYISNQQRADGGFYSCESSAQVVIALAKLNIDADADKRFVKNGVSALDSLFAYYQNGGFSHMKNEEINDMATEQALCALAAYRRYQSKKTSLYNMKR